MFDWYLLYRFSIAFVTIFGGILAAEALLRESPHKTEGQYTQHIAEGLHNLKQAAYRHALIIAGFVTGIWFIVWAVLP